MIRHVGRWAIVLGVALSSIVGIFPATVLSAEPSVDAKSGDPTYSLFNPTPKASLREFNTDRPDKTESPYTVDAGHFQIEADLFTYTKDDDTKDGTRNRSFQIFVPNLKIGVLDNLDLQLIVPAYSNVRTKLPDGSSENGEGYGDTVLRAKLNLWGNDGGDTAFGIMPFIKLPTAEKNLGNDSYEGGVILPLAVKLGEDWDLGLQTEFDVNRNTENAGYSPGFVNSATLGYGVTEEVSLYFEIFTEKRTGPDSAFLATFDTGLRYLITPDFAVDAGVNIGLTKAADYLNPFVGFAVRF